MYLYRIITLVFLVVLSINLLGSPIDSDPILEFDVEYSQEGQIAKLAWTFANNDNVAYYICEKSIDGHKFTNFSKIVSSEEAILEIDEDIQSDKLYYRVKTILKSGETVTSDIKQIQVVKQNVSINAMFYPNPIIETANIQITNYQNQSVAIAVYSAQGEEVHNLEGQKGTHHKIDFTQLESGTYFIKATIGNEVFIEKVDVID